VRKEGRISPGRRFAGHVVSKLLGKLDTDFRQFCKAFQICAHSGDISTTTVARLVTVVLPIWNMLRYPLSKVELEEDTRYWPLIERGHVFLGKKL
jgi:hypothetical protein